MSSIDERVVSMKFDNAQFEKGAKDTLGTLDKLKKGLSLEGAKNGLAGLANAGKNFTLDGIARGVNDITSRFTNLGIIGVTALANIANRAIDTGIQLTKSLTIDPISQGFGEYELKLGSIQTILSGSGESLEVVNAKLEELNTYADRTIYSFADMTQNIGKFTNAGVSLDDSVAAIQGVANVAAISGSNSNEASRAMYNFAQALSKGHVELLDWKSIELANMGTVEFKNQLLEGAVAAGTLAPAVDGMYKTLEGTPVNATRGFNESLSDQWLTTEVLTGVLGDYADETTEIGKKAFAAAQDVKTFTQLLDTAKESVGSSWAQTFEILIGDFEESKALWTGVNNVFSEIVGASAEARNNLLQGWKDLGGRDVLIESLGNAFTALMNVLAPVKEAFEQIFPPITAQTLYDMTVALRDFTESLKIGEGTAGLIKRSFAGFFAVLGIGWEIVKGLFGVLFELFGVVQDGSGGFLEITAGIGDFLVKVHEAVVEGDALGKVFDVLGGILKVIVGIIGGAVGIVASFGKALAGLFSGGGFEFDLDFNPMALILDKIIERFERFGPAIQGAIGFAKAFASIVSQVWGILSRGDFTGGFLAEDSPLVGMLFTVREHLETFWGWIKNFFKNMEFSDLTDLLNTGLFAGLLFIFKGGIDDIKGLFGGGEGGFLSSLTGIFDGVTGSLEAMQASLKADTLIKIAGAIAILAAAVLVLSLIDSGDLTKALTAITAMFIQLGAAMKVFEGIASGPGMVKMPLLAAAMILLAIAINILALAVRQMSGLSWEELAKGLVGVAGALGLLAGWAKVMSGQTGGLIRASAAMILVGIALNIMVPVIQKLGDMEWEQLGKAAAGLGGILLAIAGFGKLGGGGTLKGALSMVIVGAALHVLMGPLKELGTMDPDALIQGLIGIAAAMLVMAGGLSAMSGSIAGAASLLVASAALWILVPLLVTLGEMSWNEIAKAATMLAGSLLIIAGGMYLMTGIIAGAASLLVAVAALWVLVPLLVTMGEMSWEEIAKAAVMLAGSLLIIAGGMYLMTGALPGAAALVVVSAALTLLAPVLLALSQLSWGELLIGLAALAGLFLVLGLAGLVLAPVIPSLMLLGVAILLLGAGAALAGIGMLAFALGFTALGMAVAVNGILIIQFVKDLIGLIPYAAEQLGLGIVAVAQVIINAYPVWVGAMVTVLSALLNAINTMAPQIVQTLWNLIMLMANTLHANVPTLVQKGLELILGILRGIRDNIYEIVVVAGEIITNFINGISDQLPSIVDAGYNLIITFVESLADTINNNQARMDAAGQELAKAIINGMTSGLRNGVNTVVSAAKNVASEALNGAKNFLGIKSPSREFMKVGKWTDEGFALGMTRNAGLVEKSSKGVGATALDSMKKSMRDLSNVLDSEMDANPTIRPVMDLSSLRKDAGTIDGMFANRSIAAGTYQSAVSIADSQETSGASNAGSVVASGSTSTHFQFIQNNTSPKALSTLEIYRNTKNQMSTIKDKLAI